VGSLNRRGIDFERWTVASIRETHLHSLLVTTFCSVSMATEFTCAIDAWHSITLTDHDPCGRVLAQRYGRFVLSAGGLLLAAGIVAVSLRAGAVGMDSNVWPIVPGLIAAGAGLAFLVIPLVNVVLAAAPIEAAGGASGIFGTAQQLGGAIGVAIMGTVFFGRLASRSYLDAFTWTIPIAVAVFLACALFSLALPGTAVPEEYVEALAADGESLELSGWRREATTTRGSH
jgi:MFS family permease